MAEAEIFTLEDPNNYKVVHARVKTLWKEGSTIFLPHAKKRMTQRSIDVNDIRNILFYGSIVEHSKPMNLWRYTFKGKTIDQKPGKCIVEIDGTLIIITVIA